MHTARLAYVGLGSNLGDSPRLVRAALRRLETLSVRPLRESSLWRSSPVGCPPGSAPFVNAVAALMPAPGTLPEALLVRLQALEREFGRTPKRVLNEPRSLDLDLLAFGDEMRVTPELTLPHPRAVQRRFVLAPLAEIAPGLVWPGQTQTVAALLAALASDETVERLE